MRLDESAHNGRRGSRDPQSLLVLSSKAHHLSHVLGSVVVSNTVVSVYKYEAATLDAILGQIGGRTGNKRFHNMALIFHGSGSEMYICGPGSKILSVPNIMEDVSIREFLISFVRRFGDEEGPNRLHILACNLFRVDRGKLAQQLAGLLEMSVSISIDHFGHDEMTFGDPKYEEPAPKYIGELYFDMSKLKELLHNSQEAMKQKDMSQYEKIRMVGKGAFGTAVLYQKTFNDTLVIIKEINMHELSANERQLALNEVQVLALMHHPNIIAFYDSWEQEGVLMIEMEYADGGTLAQLLCQRAKQLEEREILLIFHQIVSAIDHMHAHNILHRDLKTANIFLTKDGMVKVGDFGISKMMTTKQAGAHTVLGTPYYISPEMCEGKQYDEKSDIWALGCILYEMACLQKTFEGSNLPALVNKIMKGQFAPIRGNYSPGFKQLVRDMLQKEPDFRPTASEVITRRLPDLLAQYSLESLQNDNMNETLKITIQGALKTAKTTKQPRSVVYHMKVYESGMSLIPIYLPPRSRIKEVAVSETHVIALTTELLVFTWGEGKRGQLGHGQLESWRSRPECVTSLKGKSITRVGAGDGFSLFASDNGIVMTCGDGTCGCLGHSDWNSQARPKLIEQLLSVDVSSVACGSHHVVVVGGDGDVYAWGRGEGGRLGLGHEEDCCVPIEAPFLARPDDPVRNVKCGGDGTIFMTEQGELLACGRNSNNKLGLNTRPGLLADMIGGKNDCTKALVPTQVRGISGRAIDVAMGSRHSCVLLETGRLVTFGDNSGGQLGRGHSRPSPQPTIVKAMSEKVITMVQCGSNFTVVGTLENTLYMWGTRNVHSNTRPNTQDAFGAQFDGSHSQPSTSRGKELVVDIEQLESDLSKMADKDAKKGIKMRDVLLEPQEILVLYASPTQIAKEETVHLSSIHCNHQSIFLAVDTTVPLPKIPMARDDLNAMDAPVEYTEEQPGNERKATPDKRERNTPDIPDAVPEYDSLGPLPDWLKAELADADIDPKKQKKKGTKKKQPARRGRKK